MHKITIENLTSASLTGVSDVLAFDDKTIILTVENNKCRICGTNLKIAKFEKENGILEISGNISLLDFSSRKQLFANKKIK